MKKTNRTCTEDEDRKEATAIVEEKSICDEAFESTERKRKTTIGAETTVANAQMMNIEKEYKRRLCGLV